MRVVHVTSWLSRRGGGIPPVIWAIARETRQRGIPCSVFGLNDRWVEEDCAINGLPVATENVFGPDALGFSPDLSVRLRGDVRPGTVIHSHGLWMHPGIVARQCAKAVKCPLVISVHGMLERWALKHSRWKKTLAAWWFENRNLRQAACLHALCAAEADNFRRYGLKNPIAIIPNGVEVVGSSNPAPSFDALAEKFTKLKGRRRILFLSRLHPKKGLSNLLCAWRSLAAESEDWCLLIAGCGQPAYEQQLRKLVADFKLENSVIFLGPLYGEDKRNALAGANVFVLPSFSEGFSMAVLEAAAAGLPIILTRDCNFPELKDRGAAIEILPDASAIEEALRHMLKMSEEQRKSMGRRGSELVARSYTWPEIARRMCLVYEWLAGNGSRPEDVTV